MSITTFSKNTNKELNFVFSNENESIIFLTTCEKRVVTTSLHRIFKNQKIVCIEYNEIESKTNREHVDYYTKLIGQLLGSEQTFEAINEFIEFEILN